MNIVVAKPPIYDEAAARFTLRGREVFAYGDTLFNPHGIPISPDLMTHERVHAAQHRHYPGGAAAWWSRYLEDPSFLASQEGEAYGAQLAFLRSTARKRGDRCVPALCHFAGTLSGEMYGSPITLAGAMVLIRRHADAMQAIVKAAARQ
jgi:hypothetical protein